MRDFTLSGEHRRIQETIREQNQGFKQALRLLDGGRIGMAAWCLGIGRAALEDALAYAQERTAFGRPIAGLQAIQFMLADMATRLDAAHGDRAGAARRGGREPVELEGGSLERG